MTMPSPLTIGISSRSLFSLEKENEIFETEGIEAYVKYQLSHENETLSPGTAFPLTVIPAIWHNSSSAASGKMSSSRFYTRIYVHKRGPILSM